MILFLFFVMPGLGFISGTQTEMGNVTLQNYQTVIHIDISLNSGHRITIEDGVNKLQCNYSSLTIPCYAECSHNNFVNKNLTDPQQSQIFVTDNYKNYTTIRFTIHTTTNCTVVKCWPEEISNLLKTKESQMVFPKDVKNINNVKNMCGAVILNETVTDTYISAEKKAIDELINNTNSNQTTTYVTKDFSLTVVSMNTSTPDDFILIPVPDVLHYKDVALTWIPVDPFLNQSQSKIGVVTYDSYEHFKVKLVNKSITSTVIRIEAPGVDLSNLKHLLKIRFRYNDTVYRPNTTLSCEFYDEQGNKTWKPDGCSTNRISNDEVECYCDHATPFALLLVDLKISKSQWEILSYISYVGCCLSAFFSAVTVFSYIFISNARAEVSSSIHVSLSAALFVLNSSFMLSEWAATLSMNGLCVFIAVTIHYSLLSSFTWMAIEAMHLYLLLIRVFNIYIKHYMIKLSVIGWGVPAVVVGGLLSVHNIRPFYGTHEMTLTDTDRTNSICWIKENIILYGVTLSYFSIVFLFNLGILITVSRQILKLHRTSRKYEKMPVWKDAGTVLGLMCLLGTTWGLAFFTSGHTIYPILYLFCIFNSMQGFYIFVWMCATTMKNGRQSLQSKTKSTVDVSR
ncbi:adhesion G-protein coupled receptor G5 isoform X2 [Danio rerio]|uniref:Adhesion G-protein coupled receptor G5 isoform X2 n=1 Tax=Danio rerio TaxID=7955 RepID=A0AC58G1M5_DANRE